MTPTRSTVFPLTLKRTATLLFTALVLPGSVNAATNCRPGSDALVEYLTLLLRQLTSSQSSVNCCFLIP
ncbi:MAG: hypothetical protein KME06_13955 [Kastovskya adunca ATA6-11-RM4]|jgi:hypothetical protein|nr:hypothetical protein [Kastovskya adunca ATA6-11-RM4]